ncbi:uncharacterized protein LOC134787612, partial [Penaeus indicus]|uniref:uncharacterized protein LOC134787612 n=1 Tax=Penaeus indicus TaxID=29960 RepID=UPI00300CDBF9
MQIDVQKRSVVVSGELAGKCGNEETKSPLYTNALLKKSPSYRSPTVKALINGRSVETLPYAAAVDLLRQISDSVTLLVSQPVVASSSSSSSAPARASSTHTTQAHTTPIVSPDARASAGPGGEGEARERKEARVQLLGGARSFITEVRSGPVTVITLNATPPPASSPAPPDPAPAVSTFEISVGPRVPAEGVKGGEAGGGPAQAVSSKQTAQIRKSRPVPTPRRSLTSSGSSTGPGPDSSSDPESSALPQSWSSLPDLKGAERGTPHTSCRGRVPRPRARRCSDSSRPDRRDGSFSHQARTVARDWPPPVRVTPSAVRRRPSLYRAELVQNDDQDRFSTCSSAESLAATPTRPRLRPATRESCFSTYDLCTTDNSRFFTVGNDDNDNKQYRTFHREFGMDLEGEAARGLDSRGRTVGGHEAWREPGAWEASVHETREGKSKSLVTESESGATKQYIKGACGPIDKQSSILSGQSGDGVSKRTSNIHNILGASSNKKSDCVSGATNKHSVHRLTNQIYSGTTNKPSDLLYSPRNKESDVACVVHKDDFKQELSDKLSSVNRNICESTYEFGRLGDDLASKGSLEQDSVSSGPLSLVPWQGSSECLLDDPCTGMEKRRKEEGRGGGVGEREGEGEVSASLSLPDLPKDTMLDRVLRCFDALHIAHSQIALRHENQDGGKGVVLNKDNLESMDTELWKHRFGIEDSRHNLFFRDFSLEEREFPESSAGSVSSAADQERIHVDQLINCSLEVQESSLCRSSEAFNRTSHAEASSTSSSPTPVTEVIITPPEGFRCDPDPSLSDEESSDSQGKPLAEQDENSPVSQTEIAGNPEHIGTAVPHTQNNVDDTLHSQINERENRKGNEPPTQTQAQEIVIEAAGTSEDKVPFRLITEREYQYHLKIKRKESASEASDSEECKEPPSENKQKQESGKTQTLLEGEIGSPKRLSNTVRPSRVAYLKGLLFGGAENQPDTSASATKSKYKGSDTNRTLQPKSSCVDAHDVYSTKDNGNNVSKDAPSVFEESYSIHDQLIRSKICEKIRTSSNSEGNERKSSVSTQASTGTHVESDYSSSSTGTPPPVNFTTHPLSSTSSKENLLDEGNSDNKEVPLTINEDIVGDSTVCISPPETKKNRFLSAQNESRFPLHKMYPDSDSESDEEEETADIKTKANVELSALSLESEKSEELELFINNPESMIVGKVCISEEDTAFEVEEGANPETAEGGEGDEASELIVFRLHVPEPSARTPSPSPPLRDGWGVDSGPTVSEELLSLEGEQFVELLPTLVKDELPTVSAQATGDPADDATPKVKVPYVLISEDVRQSYETTVTRADLDSCERWVVESRSEAPVSRMYAGATDSSPSSLSADGADSDEELEIFHTTESTPSDSHFAGPDVSDRDSATRSWSHEDHCSISEGTPLVASTKTGNDNSLIREKQKTELTVILGNTKINSRELDGYSLKNETPYFVSIRNLDIQNESAEKVKNGSEYNKSENMKDPASKYQLSDVEEEYDPAILESTESAKSRSLVGTFNFLGSEKSSSLANTPSEGPESLDDSYASLQDGVTVLGTYNFVGAGVPADAGVLRCGERPEESPELPSLTDSIISLEDGKHLLGVFDFTKPKHDLRTKARASSSEGRSSSVQCEYKDAASEEKTPDPVVQDTGLEEEVGCVQDPEGKGKSNTTEDSVSMQNRGLSPTTAEDARPSQAPPGPNSAVSQEESPQKFPSVEAVCQSPAQREEAEDGDLTQEDAEAAGEAKDVCVEAAAADDDSQA